MIIDHKNRLAIGPIIQTINLDEYAEGLELRFDDQAPRPVQVRINPPKAVLDEYAALQALSREAFAALQAAQDKPDQVSGAAAALATIGDEVAAWCAQLWSQGADPSTHWSLQDVQRLAANETDPGLYPWLIRQSLQLIAQHRAPRRKALASNG